MHAKWHKVACVSLSVCLCAVRVYVRRCTCIYNTICKQTNRITKPDVIIDKLQNQQTAEP